MPNKRKTIKQKNKELNKEGKQILSYGIQLRIFPDEQQQVLINKTFGCSRFIHNKYLADRIEFYKVNKT